jgi:iron(III) transport system substrate-binding protein
VLLSSRATRRTRKAPAFGSTTCCRRRANACGLFSVRTDSARPRSALAVGQQLGAAARPIALGPALLAHLDRSKHAALLKRWRKEIEQSR